MSRELKIYKSVREMVEMAETVIFGAAEVAQEQGLKNKTCLGAQVMAQQSFGKSQDVVCLVTQVRYDMER